MIWNLKFWIVKTVTHANVRQIDSQMKLEFEFRIDGESWWRWNLNSLVWFVGWCTRKKDENVARPRKYAFESWLGGDVDGFTRKIDENVARPRKYAFESWLGDVVVWFLAKYAIKNGKNLAENEKQWKPKNLRKIFA